MKKFAIRFLKKTMARTAKSVYGMSMRYRIPVFNPSAKLPEVFWLAVSAVALHMAHCAYVARFNAKKNDTTNSFFMFNGKRVKS